MADQTTNTQPADLAGVGYLRADAAARYAGFCERTLRTYAAKGGLPSYKLSPRLVCYRVADLDAFMRRFRKGGAA